VRLRISGRVWRETAGQKVVHICLRYVLYISVRNEIVVGRVGSGRVGGGCYYHCAVLTQGRPLLSGVVVARAARLIFCCSVPRMDHRC
jgi:hypothetical protein